MDISVIIIAWKAKHYLELCLESLEKAPPRRSMEVLVVDNASEDGTSEMIEAKFPWVKLIKSTENLGFSRGNNLAIRQCQGRYIALVNPDVIVFPGCLDALADFLDQNPKVGDVGPRVLNPDMEWYKLTGIGDYGEIVVHLCMDAEHDRRGVVGLGEPPVVPGIAAIANAVANAIGVRVPRVPMTPDRVLAALERRNA